MRVARLQRVISIVFSSGVLTAQEMKVLFKIS